MNQDHSGSPQQASRRQLLKGGSALLLGTMSAAASATPAKPAPRFDKVVDVIVVGSGFAALAAALEARENGAEVLMIEKMPMLGGNSAINGGAFAVAGSPLQEKDGIQDSPALMQADMLKAGRGLNNVDILKLIVEGTRPAFDFTVRHGVQYKPFTQHFGGHSVPRIAQALHSTGGDITVPLAKAAEKMGVEIRSRCKMEEFIRDADGRVIGVVARDRYDFPNESSGVLQTYGARRGVVMATGGFSRNLEFRKMQDPALDERLDSTNQPGATGEAMLAMFELGAAPVQIDQIQLGPWSSPDEKGFGLASQFNTIAGFPKGIMVDARTGQRFVDELADRKARSDAILTQVDAKTGKPVYPICFTDAIGAKDAQTLKNGLKYKVIHEFATLEALAQFYGMPAAGLKRQVAEFNQMVRARKDPQFGRSLDVAIELKQAPFYAVRVWPKVHYCMGGVGIDAQARVIRADRKAIAGLYAAGEVAGGTHGASRLGGCAIADGLVMGRIAGTQAAKNAPAATLRA
ncbi:MAG: flavocytochrome c [Burkholderiaceae bacterium]